MAAGEWPEAPGFCLRFGSREKRESLTSYSSKKASWADSCGLGWDAQLSTNHWPKKEWPDWPGWAHVSFWGWSALHHRNQCLEEGPPQRRFKVWFPKEGVRIFGSSTARTSMDLRGWATGLYVSNCLVQKSPLGFLLKGSFWFTSWGAEWTTISFLIISRAVLPVPGPHSERRSPNP